MVYAPGCGLNSTCSQAMQHGTDGEPALFVDAAADADIHRCFTHPITSIAASIAIAASSTIVNDESGSASHRFPSTSHDAQIYKTSHAR